MKDFITTIASIMLLMIFLLQFVTNQTIYTRLVAAENAVKEFRLATEESGKIEDTHIRSVKENAAEVLGCTAEEISVEIRELTESELKKDGFTTDDETKEADDKEEKQESLNRFFEYRVDMPVRGLVGPADFLGISEIENSTVHTSKGLIRIAEEPKKEKDEADEASRENKEGSDESSSEKGENGDSFEDGKSTEKEHEEYDNNLGDNDTV